MFDLKLLHIVGPSVAARSVVIQPTSTIDLLMRLRVIVLLLNQVCHIVALLALAQIYIGTARQRRFSVRLSQIVGIGDGGSCSLNWQMLPTRNLSGRLNQKR